MEVRCLGPGVEVIAKWDLATEEHGRNTETDSFHFLTSVFLPCSSVAKKPGASDQQHIILRSISSLFINTCNRLEAANFKSQILKLTA